MMTDSAATIMQPRPHPGEYAAWQLTPERQRHEWKRVRRAIIAMRVRLLIYGHLVFFAGCVILNLLGNRAASDNFMSVGCYSLLLTSLSLLLTEWLHVRFPPQHPPRYVVRPSGITEYGDEGPRQHWDWTRILQVRLESDRERPEFRSLIFVNRGLRCFQGFNRIAVPLPEASPPDGADVDEWNAIAAVGVALTENGYNWQRQLGGNDVRIVERRCVSRVA